LKVFLCGPLRILCVLCVKKAVFNAETAEELAILDTTCQFDRKNQIEVPFMLF